MLPTLVLLACALPGDGPKPYNDLDGDFFDAPWPSDLRRADAGGLSMAGFPHADDYPLLEDYAAALEERVDGAGTNAPIYFRFQGPLDTERLPTPEESVLPGASLMLVNVDPESPEFGELVPVQWRFTESSTTYQPENLLAVAPLSGFPLRPGTTYAALLTTEVARQDREMAGVWYADSPDNDYWSTLQDALFGLGVAVEEVAIATRFTTDDPISELREYAAHVKTFEALALDQPLHTAYTADDWTAWEGRLYLPLWQHGEKPYNTEGGGFKRDSTGAPAMAGWELTTFTLATPNGTPPEGGWPVVLYSHGTGGDHTTCCNSDVQGEPARVLTSAGFAVLGISQPLHGDRATEDTDPTWHSFNYLNLDAALCTFRQSALDLVYVSHLLAGRQQVFDLEGQEVSLDPDQVFFMGHSQGGITGAMAAPFFGDDVVAMVLSGAGGGLSLSLAYREDPALGEQTASELVSGLLEFDDDEVLDELHPVAAVVQALGEVTDPLNYSPFWFRAPIWAASRPLHALVTEGLNDAQTPPRSTDALAAAAGVPVLDPAATEPAAILLRGLPVEAVPTSGNQLAFDGSPVTTGLAQFPDEDHYAIFYNQDAMELYRDFLLSARDGNLPTLGL